MAMIYPKVEDTSSIRPISEQQIYVALRDQLPGDYVVFHSYPWLRRWRGDADKALMEGEADFVILHPRRGLLVLEVKGGDIRTSGVDTWYRLTEKGRDDIQDPFKQAQRNMRALISVIGDWLRDNREQLRVDGRNTELAFGFAVWFPDVNYSGSLPAHADHAIVLGHRDLHDAQGAIDRAFAAWESEPRPLDDRKFNVLFRSLSARPVFVRPIGAQIASAQEKMLLLTESQSAAYRALLRGSRRMLVQGPAGSGKTELALTRAVELAGGGSRVLLTCYNRELAIWLRERVEADPVLADLPGKLDVFSFHELCARMARQAKLEWAPEDTDAFWNERVYQILATAAGRLEESGDPIRYDAIMLDEAQDFYENWWWGLAEELLVEDGLLYAFLDPNQSLRADAEIPAALGMEGPVMISENCRNTKRIADLSAKTIGGQLGLYRLAPEGVQPRVVWVKTVNRQQPQVEEEIRRLINLHSLLPEQIVLVGISKSHGSLAGLDEIAGVPLTRSAEEWRQGGAILATTSRSFKGLEADVVVIHDLGGLNKYFTREDLYVACSRARFHLSVLVHRDRALFLEILSAAKAQKRAAPRRRGV